MGYIEQTLVPGEEIIFRTKPAWIIFTAPLGWLFLAILILFLGPHYSFINSSIFGRYTLVDLFGFFAIIAALFSGIGAFINYQTSEFGITNRRILMKVGFISRISLEILLQRVESIQVYQSITGRIFNYGTIIISGIGGSKDPFPNIPDPLLFRHYAQQQLDKQG